MRFDFSTWFGLKDDVTFHMVKECEFPSLDLICWRSYVVDQVVEYAQGGLDTRYRVGLLQQAWPLLVF